MANGIALSVDGETEGDVVNTSEIEVLESWNQPTRYELRYNLDIYEGDFPLLVNGSLDPGKEVSVFATTDANVHCLVKGPIHRHAINMINTGNGTELVVTGADNSILMAREDKSVQWSDVSDADAVSSILASYGFVPDVQATDALHAEDKHSLIQRSNDLAFIRKLARRNGFLFWLSCDADLIDTAHFKAPPLDDTPALDLIINLDESNLDEVKFSWDVEKPDSITASQLDLNTLGNIDGNVSDSNLTLMGNQDLASIRGAPFSTHINTPVNDAGDLQARGRGTLTESNMFVRVTCASSVLRIGDAVRSHSIVNLRGAGSRYSGYYLVAAVRHLIDSSSHLMEITLVRNGW